MKIYKIDKGSIAFSKIMQHNAYKESKLFNLKGKKFFILEGSTLSHEYTFYFKGFSTTVSGFTDLKSNNYLDENRISLDNYMQIVKKKNHHINKSKILNKKYIGIDRTVATNDLPLFLKHGATYRCLYDEGSTNCELFLIDYRRKRRLLSQPIFDFIDNDS